MSVLAHLFITPEGAKFSMHEAYELLTSLYGYDRVPEPHEVVSDNYRHHSHLVVIHAMGDPDLEALSRIWDTCTLVDLSPADIGPSDERVVISQHLRSDTQARVHFRPKADTDPTTSVNDMHVDVLSAALSRALLAHTSAVDGYRINVRAVAHDLLFNHVEMKP